MPLDILQELEEQTKSVNDDALSASFEAMKEKAGQSSEVLSVLQSIVDSMAGSSENLHGKLSKIIRDFETYDKIVSQSVGTNRELSESWKDFGVSGVNGVQAVNQGLTTSISLMRSVQSEIDKYHQSFAKIEKAVGQMKMPRFETLSPSPKLGSIPTQSFRTGGKVQGTSTTGDKNLVRVNAGEWIFTAKQMKNLARLTGSKSSSEVFSKAGGNPSLKKYDSQGRQMFSEGGSLRRGNIESRAQAARTAIKDAYSKATSRQERDRLEQTNKLIERVLQHVDQLDDDDFKLKPGFEEDLLRHLDQYNKDVNAAIQSGDLEKYFKDLQSHLNQKNAKATQSATGNVPFDKMFQGLNAQAKEFAIALERAKRVAEAQGVNQATKENARREAGALKVMLDLSQLKYLTKAQREQQQDIIQRYNNAKTIEEKEKIANEAHEGGQLSLNETERSIGATDAALIKFNKSSDAMVESWKSFLGGTPVGLMAVGAAIGFAGKQLAGFMNNISGSVENLAKLSLQTGALKTNMDSTFGAGTFDNFRKTLNLTREEVVSLGPAMKDAFRNAGVEMENIQATAENIKDAFGTMDASKLQEALGVLGELTGEQQKILIQGGGGTASDTENMYANLMASGKSGQAADLLEQGVFGGEAANNPNLSEGDKEIVKALQDMKVVQENISVTLKDKFSGILPTLLKFGKWVAMIAPIMGGVISTAITVKAMSKMATGTLKSTASLDSKLQVPMPTTNNGGSGGGSGGFDISDLFGKGKGLRKLKALTRLAKIKGGGSVIKGGAKLIGGLAKSGIGGIAKGVGSVAKGLGPAATSAIGSGLVTIPLGMLASHYGKKQEEKEAKEKQKHEENYEKTGYVSGNASLELDLEKANAEALKTAQSYAVTAGILAGIATTLTGVGAWAAGGVGLAASAAGGAIGYGVGYEREIRRQIGENADNPLLQTTDDKGEKKLNVQLLAVAARAQKDIEALRKTEEKNLQEMKNTLRFQEGIERVVKKIESGAYSRFDDMTVEGAKASNSLVTTMGGSDASYGANISKILNSSTKSYEKNMEQINAKRRDILKKEGVNYAAKISASNELIKQQARVTQKWLSEILASVGEYDKIPTVIQNSLQKKISEINITSANKGFGNVSGLAYNAAKETAKNGVSTAGATMSQFMKESKQVDAAMKTAEEQGQQAIKRYQETQESGQGVDWLRKDVVDENGKISEEAMSANETALKTKRDELDEIVKQKSGFTDGSYAETVQHMDEIKANQGAFADIASEIDNASDEDFNANKAEYLKKLKEQMSASRDALADTESSNATSELKTAAAEGRAALESSLKEIEELEKNGGAAKITKDQLKKFAPISGMIAGSAASHVEEKMAEAEADPEVKKRRDELGKAQVLQNELSSAHDSQTAAKQAMLKMIQGFQQQVEEVRQSAMMLVNQVDQDPSAIFWRTAQSAMESAKDSMLETGKFGDYAAATITNTANEIASMKEAAKKAEGDLAENREAIQAKVKETISQGVDEGKVNEVMGMTAELSNARLNYSKNQTSENEKAVKDAEAKLNAFLDANFSKDDPNREKIMALISMQTASDEAAVNLQKKQNEIASKNFQMFKTMISLMDGYKNTLEYLKTEAVGRQSDAGLRMARKNLDSGAASRYADMGIKNAKEQYEISIKGIDENYQNSMKELDEEEKSIKSDQTLSEPEKAEKLKVIADKRTTLGAESESRKLEAAAKMDDDIVKAAQAEYEAKKRTSELAMDALDAQSDFLQSVGAPMEAILANERQRVGMMQEQAQLAKENYEKLVASGASQEEQLKARNDAMKAETAAMKARYGAQRSAMEKMFGNMIGAFNEVAGIMGPNNLASKYGYGYYENSDGAVAAAGDVEGDTDYQTRVFAANALHGNGSQSPMSSGDVPLTPQGVISPSSSGASSPTTGNAPTVSNGNSGTPATSNDGSAESEIRVTGGDKTVTSGGAPASGSTGVESKPQSPAPENPKAEQAPKELSDAQKMTLARLQLRKNRIAKENGQDNSSEKSQAYLMDKTINQRLLGSGEMSEEEFNEYSKKIDEAESIKATLDRAKKASDNADKAIAESKKVIANIQEKPKTEQQKEPEKPKPPTDVDKGLAGKNTRKDADWKTLGESFKSETQGLEAVVFWEKKIFNLLTDSFGVISSGDASKSTTDEKISVKQGKGAAPMFVEEGNAPTETAAAAANQPPPTETPEEKPAEGKQEPEQNKVAGMVGRGIMAAMPMGMGMGMMGMGSPESTQAQAEAIGNGALEAGKISVDSVEKAGGSLLGGIWEGIKSTVSGIGKGIAAEAKGLWKGGGQILSGDFKEGLSTIWNGEKEAGKARVEGIWNAGKSVVGGGWDAAKTLAGGAWDAGKALASGFSNANQIALDEEELKKQKQIATAPQNPVDEKAEDPLKVKEEVKKEKETDFDKIISWEEKIAKILVETAKFNSKNKLKDLKQKGDSAFYDVEVAGKSGGSGGLFGMIDDLAFSDQKWDKIEGIENRAKEAEKDDSEFSATLDELIAPKEEAKKEEVKSDVETAPVKEDLVPVKEISKAVPVPLPANPEQKVEDAFFEDTEAAQADFEKKNTNENLTSKSEDQLLGEQLVQGAMRAFGPGGTMVTPLSPIQKAKMPGPDLGNPGLAASTLPVVPESAQPNPASPASSDPAAIGAADSSYGKSEGDSSGGSGDTASGQKLMVEVKVKFDNKMFEESVKRIATSAGTARQITRSGMESQNA